MAMKSKKSSAKSKKSSVKPKKSNTKSENSRPGITRKKAVTGKKKSSPSRSSKSTKVSGSRAKTKALVAVAVFLKNTKIGELTQDHVPRQRAILFFEYNKRYLSRPDATPLARGIPLRLGIHKIRGLPEPISLAIEYIEPQDDYGRPLPFGDTLRHLALAQGSRSTEPFNFFNTGFSVKKIMR